MVMNTVMNMVMNMIMIIISSEAIFSDAWLMAGGYILMFGYTILMLGRWNTVEVIVQMI